MDERPSKTRARWRTAALAVLQVACVAYVVHSLWGGRAELGRALDLSVAALAGLSLLMLLAHLQRTLEFTYMLRRLGVNEPFWDGFLLTGAGYLLNHLPFNAGLVMRAALLKRDHALPYTSYVSLTLVNALINVAVGALVGLVAAGLSGRGGTSLPLLVFGGVVASSSLLLWLPRSWAPRTGGFVARRLRTLLDGVVLIRGNGLGIALLALLALARIAGVALRLWVCFGALGATITPLGAVLLGWGSVLFTLVNVTPGNLGLRELVLSFAAAELGSTRTIGMAATSMDRVVLLAYIVAVGVPGLYSLRRRRSLSASPASGAARSAAPASSVDAP
jgi:uncharacterized membrane protein YbhN (UPF0104 family)